MKINEKIILGCNAVEMKYDGQRVFADLSFNVHEGEYVGIVGENGSGKSTLLKAFLGLEKPYAGSLSLNCGKASVGYLPQQTSIQRNFPALVEEIVLSGCRHGNEIMHFHGKDERKYAEKTLKELYIYDLKNKSYRELSIGQQQKVLLARALCAARKLLLLDEPAASLDPKAAGEMYALLKDINKKQGITVMMVSHDVNNVVLYADKILHMSKDSYFFGTVDEYLFSEQSENFFKKRLT